MSSRPNGDDEKLVEIGLYTLGQDEPEITIYTGLGTSMPASPAEGTKILTQSSNTRETYYSTIYYSGYHTVRLERPVSLRKGEYFSVVVKYPKYYLMPVETKIPGFSDNAVIEPGSFFSSNGEVWYPGESLYFSPDVKGMNATIKAFTITAEETGEEPAVIAVPPEITTTVLPAGTPGVAYSASLSASGTAPMTWSIVRDSLPAGLSLDASSGVISGTPESNGSYTFWVRAENTKANDTKSFTINITSLPAITTVAFDFYKGYEVSERMKLNTNQSAKWSAGNLPLSLKLNETTGAITGKPKTPGVYTIDFTAETSAGKSNSHVIITVHDKPVKPKIKTSSLHQVTFGEAVNEVLNITGTEPITVSVTEGMPKGLHFSPATYTFYGTPSETGTFSMKVTATNIANTINKSKATEKKVKLVVKAEAPKIAAPEKLPDGIAGQTYSGYTVSISEGTAPEKWTASGLPKGLTIDAKSGTISGTPQKAGKFKVAIKAQNNGGKDATDKIPLTVYEKPEITVKKLKDGKTDKPYSAKIAVKGNPETVEISGLPSGLAQSTDKKGNAVITGTPAVVGSYSVVIAASNDAGMASKTFTLKINGVPPKIKASLPKGTAGSDYDGTITVTGTKPLTISYDIQKADRTKYGISSLEELGLTFTASTAGTAKITGTPTCSVKGLPVYISAINPAVKSPVTKKTPLKISGTKPQFTSPSDGTLSFPAKSAVNIDISVTGTEKITFTMKGANGFKLTQTGTHTASLTGTAPAQNAKPVKLTITAQNADGKASKKLVLQAQEASVNKNTDSLEEQDSGDTVSPETPAEQTVTFGESRILTPEESAMLAREGLMIAAVLPELTVNKSGMYDLSVSLNPEAETGAKLFWLAGARPPSDDDSIAEFYDSEGGETESVPESHEITVSVWLNAETVYRPVIAVMTGQ